MSAWGCKTCNFDVASSSAGWVFASVVEVTGVWVSECFLGQLQPRQNVAKVVLFIGLMCIYIFFFQTETVARQTPNRFIVCNAFILMCYIQIAADWLKPPTHPPNERKCGPKSMLPKKLHVSVKKTKQNKNKAENSKSAPFVAQFDIRTKFRCLLNYLSTLLRFLK